MSDSIVTSAKQVQSFVWLSDNKIYKLSLADDYVAEHENAIATALATYVPNHRNLVKYLGSTNTFIKDDGDIKAAMPKFLKTNGYSKQKYTTIWENINGWAIGDFLKKQEISDKIIFNCVLQVFFTLFELQEKIKFVHGDLHTNNVLVTKSDNNNPFVYKIANGDILLENFGYTIKIIDFGNSYIWEDSPVLSTPLYSYKAGDINLFYDQTYDLRVFGNSISVELWNNRDMRYTDKLRKAYENFFCFFVLDERFAEGRIEPRFDIYEIIIDHFEEMYIKIAAKKNTPKSFLIEKSPTKFIDLILPLVNLPIEIVEFDNKNSEEDVVENIEEYFRQDGVLWKFIKKWCVYESLCTTDQSIVLLSSVVLFVSTAGDKQTDHEEFYLLIDKKLKEFGQDKIQLKKEDVKLLFYLLKAAGSSIKNIINYLAAEYTNKIKDAYDNTVKMCTQFGSSNINIIMLNILDKIYKSLNFL